MDKPKRSFISSYLHLIWGRISKTHYLLPAAMSVIFRQHLDEWMAVGVDFSTHLYVPEVDRITGEEIHERSDHNHLLKRIATSTREGHYQALDLQAFDDAMLDRNTGNFLSCLGLNKSSMDG